MPNMQETEVTIHVTNVVHAQQEIGWFCPEDTYLLAGTLGDQKTSACRVQLGGIALVLGLIMTFLERNSVRYFKMV